MLTGVCTRPHCSSNGAWQTILLVSPAERQKRLDLLVEVRESPPLRHATAVPSRRNAPRRPVSHPPPSKDTTNVSACMLTNLGAWTTRAHTHTRTHMARVQGTKTKPPQQTDEFKATFLYHVRLIRMLATCCEGDNRFIHSMCQNIFDVDDLFEVLLHPDIGMMFKRPYMRFLLWAYMNAEINAYKVADIGYEKRTWQFIDAVVKFTYTILDKVRTRDSWPDRAAATASYAATHRIATASAVRGLGVRNGATVGTGPGAPAGYRPGRAGIDVFV